MKVAILVFTLFLISCSSKSQNQDSQDEQDLHDFDNTQPDIDTTVPDPDISDDLSDDLSDEADEESEALAESDETPDVDMYCPLPMDAQYPYFREDGTIHFCRPCDTPDEYDPQCVKSLWKDKNREVYDKYMNGEFEGNEYVAECYPWPCEWKVTPRQGDHIYAGDVMKCDLIINPWNWTTSHTGSRRESNMDGGKIVFRTSNYRISDQKIKSDPGYGGQRAAMYNIETGKYEIISGSPGIPAYMNGFAIISVYSYIKRADSTYDLQEWPVSVVPYKGSYKYNVIYHHENNHAGLDVFPYFTDKWTIMVVNHYDHETDPVGAGNRSLMYAKTGEWKWTTLAYGNPDGKAGELSIAGDKAMFAHIATNTSYICDLSKNPKSISDCKKISRDGEVAGFPKFDRDNPNRIVYRSMGEGKPTNRFVAVDISKEPWVIEKEFEIPSTEGTFLSMWLTEVRSNLLLYHENYVLKASGYQEDGKLCFYRMDKEKVYCSKPIEGQTDYGHGFPAMEGKYLFWQPAFKTGYILRDMECYCKETGVCPFEE